MATPIGKRQSLGLEVAKNLLDAALKKPRDGGVGERIGQRLGWERIGQRLGWFGFEARRANVIRTTARSRERRTRSS
jgi:hypothetical protein